MLFTICSTTVNYGYLKIEIGTMNDLYHLICCFLYWKWTCPNATCFRHTVDKNITILQSSVSTTQQGSHQNLMLRCWVSLLKQNRGHSMFNQVWSFNIARNICWYLCDLCLSLINIFCYKICDKFWFISSSELAAFPVESLTTATADIFSISIAKENSQIDIVIFPCPNHWLQITMDKLSGHLTHRFVMFLNPIFSWTAHLHVANRRDKALNANSRANGDELEEPFLWKKHAHAFLMKQSTPTSLRRGVLEVYQEMYFLNCHTYSNWL